MRSNQRRLFIMRHAKSSWDTSVRQDFDRPLNRRGESDAPRMGHWLQKTCPQLDAFLCSPAQRCRQTARLVSSKLEFPVEQISWEPAVYEATLGDLLKLLAKLPSSHNAVLLLGHNPGLEYLLRYLLGTAIDSRTATHGTLFPTAAIAELEVTRPWTLLEDGGARLVTLVQPKNWVE